MKAPSLGGADGVLLILIGLLTISLVCFLAGWLPYPIGWLVMTFVIAARIMHLRNTGGKRGACG